MEVARAAARWTQSGTPGGMGQVLRAVEIERLRTVKRPAGWVPEGAPARKLRAGTGTGLLIEGKYYAAMYGVTPSRLVVMLRA